MDFERLNHDLKQLRRLSRGLGLVAGVLALALTAAMAMPLWVIGPIQSGKCAKLAGRFALLIRLSVQKLEVVRM